MMMHRRFPPLAPLFPSRMESVWSQRILSLSWFLAACGVACLQVLLLAQVWHVTSQAFLVACVAGAWMLGTVLGMQIRFVFRRLLFPCVPALWGIGTSGLTFFLLFWHGSGWVPPLLTEVSWMLLRAGTIALLLGTTSTGWLLGERQSWPPLLEMVGTARGILCLTIGLLIVWSVPRWGGIIGLFFLLPLLCLDLCPPSWCPFLMRGIWIDRIIDRPLGVPASWLPLHIAQGGRGWWIVWLARRNMLFSTLLAMGISIITGGIWFSVPTPFAAFLAQTHQLWILPWLVAGQVLAFLLATLAFQRQRSMLGELDRLIPPKYHALCWRIASLALALMAVGLMLLGLPWLQTPWGLSLSLALYTLAGCCWTRVFVRLRSSVLVQEYSLRHLLVHRPHYLDQGRLVYEKALEDRVLLICTSYEGVLTACMAGGLGLLIERVTFDRTLLFAGATLLLTLLAIGAVRMRTSPMFLKIWQNSAASAATD